MKAVFDSNIFVSALAIPGGQAERVLNLAIDGQVTICISKAIMLALEEYSGIRALSLREFLDEVAAPR